MNICLFIHTPYHRVCFARYDHISSIRLEHLSSFPRLVDHCVIRRFPVTEPASGM